MPEDKDVTTPSVIEPAGGQNSAGIADVPLPESRPELVPDETGDDLDEEHLKALFQAKDKKEIQPLLNLLSSRVNTARLVSFSKWRTFAAIDVAWNTPFHQVTPTILSYLLSPDRDRRGTEAQQNDAIAKELEAWGLSEDSLFYYIDDKSCQGGRRRVLRQENLFRIIVPIVQAAVYSRCSTMFVERNLTPLFDYEPVQLTNESATVGDVITSVVEGISNAYGYPAVLQQVILQSLKYGYQWMFPSEAWHRELNEDDTVKKQGIRYTLPHPSRTACDNTYRPSSINTDTGVEWACWWDIRTYGDIIANTEYWNTKSIPFGTDWFDVSNNRCALAFTNYYPCIAKPFHDSDNWLAAKNDRVDKAAWQTYGTNDNDKAVFITGLDCKLNPKQWGLSKTQNRSVWMRFVIANDGTILWAQRFKYRPPIFFGIDLDEALALSPSFALQAIPWQDMVSNLLTQQYITTKQNLMLLFFYDQDLLSESNVNEMLTRTFNTQKPLQIPLDRERLRARNKDPREALIPVQLPFKDTTQNITCLNTVLNLMDRVLQTSPQSQGATSSHVTSAREQQEMAQAVQSRLEFAGVGIDMGIYAWKQQLFDAWKAYGEEQYSVVLNDVPDDMKERLKSEYGMDISTASRGMITVKGSKSDLDVSGFISRKDRVSRDKNPQVAGEMMKAIASVMGNPQLLQMFGPDWVGKNFELIWLMAGFPKDTVPHIPQGANQQQQAQIQQQLAEAAQQIVQAATQQSVAESMKTIQPTIEHLQETLKEFMDKSSQAIKQTQTGLQEVGQAAQQAEAKEGQQEQAITSVAEHLQNVQQVLDHLTKIVQAAAQPQVTPTSPTSLTP